jgi:hypothetical protein
VGVSGLRLTRLCRSNIISKRIGQYMRDTSNVNDPRIAAFYDVLMEARTRIIEIMDVLYSKNHTKTEEIEHALHIAIISICIQLQYDSQWPQDIIHEDHEIAASLIKAIKTIEVEKEGKAVLTMNKPTGMQ